MSSIFQPLPILPTLQPVAGGVAPFGFIDLSSDMVSIGELSPTRGSHGPFDGTFTVPPPQDPVTEPAVPAPQVTVPAAVLLASLDRSARAFMKPPAVVSPHPAKSSKADGRDETPAIPATPDEPGLVARDPKSPAADPVVIPPINPLPQTVVAPTPLPVEATAVSLPTGGPVGPKPSFVSLARAADPVPVAVASLQPFALIATDRTERPIDALQPSVMPQFVAVKPVARWLPTQDAPPPVAATQVMQIDGPRMPGPTPPRVPDKKTGEPDVPMIFVTETKDAAITDAVDSARLDIASPASTLAILPAGPAQPAIGPSPVAELLASSPMPSDVAAIDRQLDLARGDVWLDTLARDIAASADGEGRLRFALAPERLGKLDVELSHGEAGVSVHLTTRNEEARAIIAAAQPRLVEELRAQGTRVASTDVSAQTGEQQGGTPRHTTASFIEAAVEARASTADATLPVTADGRYA